MSKRSMNLHLTYKLDILRQFRVAIERVVPLQCGTLEEVHNYWRGGGETWSCFTLHFFYCIIKYIYSYCLLTPYLIILYFYKKSGDVGL